MATSAALLETVVTRGFNKIMPMSFAAKLAPPFIAALKEGARINATMGSVANSAIEAAFLPVMTVLLTGALTPTLGFAMGSVTATVGARFAYDAIKSTAGITLDVMKQIEEIRKELKKEEEERAAKRVEMEPVGPSLEAMMNMSDEVLEENILTNLENQTKESKKTLPQTQAGQTEVVKQAKEIKKEIKKEEERTPKRMKMEPVEPSLRAMANTPDQVLEENILKNIAGEKKSVADTQPRPTGESDGLSAAAAGGPNPSGEETQRDTESSQEIQRDRDRERVPLVEISSKKRPREALYPERVFSRDTSLNGLPISWTMQHIMVRDDDQLRVPIA